VGAGTMMAESGSVTHFLICPELSGQLICG
jgi:hypothetical protein